MKNIASCRTFIYKSYLSPAGFSTWLVVLAEYAELSTHFHPHQADGKAKPGMPLKARQHNRISKFPRLAAVKETASVKSDTVAIG